MGRSMDMPQAEHPRDDDDGRPGRSAARTVQIISTGSVRIRPEQADGTRKPLYWWLLTSRRWSHPAKPIHVYVIDHPDGLVLFDAGQARAASTDPGRYFPGGPLGFLY